MGHYFQFNGWLIFRFPYVLSIFIVTSRQRCFLLFVTSQHLFLPLMMTSHFKYYNVIQPLRSLSQLNSVRLFCHVTWAASLLSNYLLFLKRDNPSLFYRLFSVFSNKYYYNFTQQIFVKICPSIIWCREPRPLEHESPLISTRPGLPPSHYLLCDVVLDHLSRSQIYAFFNLVSEATNRLHPRHCDCGLWRQ